MTMKTSQTGRLILPHHLNGPVYFIARQPIFDRNLDVFAYELLYRSNPENFVNVMDGDQATLAVLINTFSQAGLRTVVGSRKAFINLTRSFLTGAFPIPLPPDLTVLEITEDIVIDDELIRSVKKLLEMGYQIALDDVISVEQVGRLAGLAQFVKVDISDFEFYDLANLTRELRKHPVSLLAEKVETMQEYHACREMGFDYFQGFFFCRPEMVPVRKVSTSRLVLQQAMANLQDPQASAEDLERIISMDVTLSYRLLKLVNSGYYLLKSPITSIGQAIAMIGLTEFSHWLSLLLMAKTSDKPHELSTQALFRAKMAESLAQDLKLPDSEGFFMVGLLSVLDALLDMPMSEVIEGMQLSKAIAAALLQRAGPMGAVLHAIETLETGDWKLAIELNLGARAISAVYLDSLEWTQRLMKAVS
jgi:c-di-GMP phosphodiesterase